MADLTAGVIPKAADGNHIEDGYPPVTSVGDPGTDANMPTEKAVRDGLDTKAAAIHAATHTNGTDDIQLATAAQNGVATAAQISKLDGIEPLADVTDATNVATAGAVMHTQADAKGDILAASGDNSFARVPVGSDGQLLAADSGQAAGVGWQNAGVLSFVNIDNTDSPYTAAGAVVIICDTTGGAITVNLPAAASSAGVIYRIKKISASANNVTVDGNGGETIDDALTVDITAQYESIDVFCDGVEWWIL